jgi:hypothetical protein
MKVDVSPNPLKIALLGSIAVMPPSDGIAHLIQQTWLASGAQIPLYQ